MKKLLLYLFYFLTTTIYSQTTLLTADRKFVNKDYKGAVLEYDKLIAIDPNNAVAVFYRGKAKECLNDYKGALEDYLKSSKLSPSYIPVIMQRASIRFKLTDKQGACDDWANANKLGDRDAKDSIAKNCKGAIATPTTTTISKTDLKKKAEEYYKLGLDSKDLKTAIENYTNAIELMPDYNRAYYVRALAKYNLKNYHSAIEDYNKLAELNADDGEVYYYRGCCKFYLKDNEGACMDWRKASRLGELKANSWIVKIASR